MPMNRRDFLGIATATAASSQISAALGQVRTAQADTVRDRLWVFCNPINADYNMVGRRSAISPIESALYLGIPNLMMVNQYPEAGIEPAQDSFYQEWRSPFELYAYPAKKLLKRVVWSIVGAGGKTNPNERREVMQMARKTPNIVGITMDDFFRKGGASLTPDQLRDIQHELKQPQKPLDLYVTLYTNQLNDPIIDYLNQIDVVTLWTWETDDLANLEANLKRLEQIAPRTRKILGCYTTALNPKNNPRWTPLPIPAMRQQCETGLRWLKQKRIDGMMIYGNFLDLGWEVIDWTRDWAQRVGDMAL